MTNEEKKARELIDKFENYSFIDIDQKISAFQTAKQCALICVEDEINLFRELIVDLHLDDNEIALKKYRELKTIKQIIEQL